MASEKALVMGVAWVYVAVVVAASNIWESLQKTGICAPDRCPSQSRTQDLNTILGVNLIAPTAHIQE